MLVLDSPDSLRSGVLLQGVDIAQRRVLDVIGRALDDQAGARGVLGGDRHLQPIEVRQPGLPVAVEAGRLDRGVRDVLVELERTGAVDHLGHVVVVRLDERLRIDEGRAVRNRGQEGSIRRLERDLERGRIDRP